MPQLHADELTVDEGLVRALVDRAFPQYRSHRLTPQSSSGSTNKLFRLGRDLLVRVPRQPGGGRSIEKEARWLPFVRSRMSAAVPEVVGVGEPNLGYPEHWSICTWLTGSTPRAGTSAGASIDLPRDLARLVAQLRSMEVPDHVPDDRDLSWYRGEPLSSVDPDFRMTVEECRRIPLGLDLDEALRVWDLAVDASCAEARVSAWFHGDLVSENLLLDGEGGLSAVLDFGGLAIGDPTVDLVVAWEVLDEDGRRDFRRELDVDDAAWTASRGWALFIALITFPYYAATMPARCADRLVMVHEAIAAR